MKANSNEIIGKLPKNTRAIAVMDEPKKIADKVLFPKKFILAMTTNTWSITAVPTVLIVTGHSETLDTKETVVSTRVIGSASDRDVAYNVVKLDLFCWKAQVQMKADQDPTNAITIIESYGFRVKHVPKRQKPPLSVKKGTAPNSAILKALAVGRKASYDWEWSGDGQAWTRFGKSTPVANTSMTDIRPNTLYYFRYRGNTTKEEGSWSDPVAFVRL